jgi:hypothetical protein
VISNRSMRAHALIHLPQECKREVISNPGTILVQVCDPMQGAESSPAVGTRDGRGGRLEALRLALVVGWWRRVV